jgi:tripartite-type tricarboxylate transporter receptor subunit TctC
MLFLANISTNSINPNIYKKLPFDVGEELEPVVLVANTPNVLAVGKEVPVKSVRELVELAKVKQLNFGTPGTGSSGHLSAQMFATLANVKFQHVPYKGSPQVETDLLNGNLQFTIDNVLTWAPLAKSDRVRAIAVTGLRRSDLLPDVPTLDESGYPGYQAVSWFGIAAPKGTPREVIVKLNADINSVIEASEFRQKLSGAEVVGGTPEAFKAFIAAERKKWGEVTRAINLTVD